jgi:hypothetical protein
MGFLRLFSRWKRRCPAKESLGEREDELRAGAGGAGRGACRSAGAGLPHLLHSLPSPQYQGRLHTTPHPGDAPLLGHLGYTTIQLQLALTIYLGPAFIFTVRDLINRFSCECQFFLWIITKTQKRRIGMYVPTEARKFYW